MLSVFRLSLIGLVFVFSGRFAFSSEVANLPFDPPSFNYGVDPAAFYPASTVSLRPRAKGYPIVGNFSASWLPSWLHLDPVTGVLSGTAPAVEEKQLSRFDITVTDVMVTDAEGFRVPRTLKTTFTYRVNKHPGVAELLFDVREAVYFVNTPILPNTPKYRGAVPASFSVTSGKLPAGLSMDASGVISGIPSVETARKPVTVTVKNANNSDRASFVLYITVKQQSIRNLRYSEIREIYFTNEDITLQPSVEGGPATAYKIVDGVLPAGLALKPDGVIQGRIQGILPTTEFTISASNGNNSTVTKIRFAVQNREFRYTPTLEVAAGEALSLAPVAKPGNITRYETESSLPRGLELNNETGEIKGVPAEIGRRVFTILAHLPFKDRAPLRATIEMTAYTTELPDRILKFQYTHPSAYYKLSTPTDFPNFPLLGNLYVKGRYTAPNRLPAGLSVDPDYGDITGTPTRVMSARFPIQVSHVPYLRNPGGKIEWITLNTEPIFSISRDRSADLFGFDYGSTLQVLRSGKTMVSIVPRTSWHVSRRNGKFELSSDSPRLIDGVNLDSVTGVISGTPTGGPVPPTEFTINFVSNKTVVSSVKLKLSVSTEGSPSGESVFPTFRSFYTVREFVTFPAAGSPPILPFCAGAPGGVCAEPFEFYLSESRNVWDWLKIDRETGALSGTPPPDESEEERTFQCTVTITNRSGASTQQTVEIRVDDYWKDKKTPMYSSEIYDLRQGEPVSIRPTSCDGDPLCEKFPYYHPATLGEESSTRCGDHYGPPYKLCVNSFGQIGGTSSNPTWGEVKTMTISAGIHQAWSGGIMVNGPRKVLKIRYRILPQWQTNNQVVQTGDSFRSRNPSEVVKVYQQSIRNDGKLITKGVVRSFTSSQGEAGLLVDYGGVEYMAGIARDAQGKWTAQIWGKTKKLASQPLPKEPTFPLQLTLTMGNNLELNIGGVDGYWAPHIEGGLNVGPVLVDRQYRIGRRTPTSDSFDERYFQYRSGIYLRSDAVIDLHPGVLHTKDHKAQYTGFQVKRCTEKGSSYIDFDLQRTADSASDSYGWTSLANTQGIYRTSTWTESSRKEVAIRTRFRFARDRVDEYTQLAGVRIGKIVAWIKLEHAGDTDAYSAEIFNDETLLQSRELQELETSGTLFPATGTLTLSHYGGKLYLKVNGINIFPQGVEPNPPDIAHTDVSSSPVGLVSSSGAHYEFPHDQVLFDHIEVCSPDAKDTLDFSATSLVY